MATLPEVGLTAVVEGLSDFKKGTDAIIKGFGDIDTASGDVESSSGKAGGAIKSLGGIASSVASVGMAAMAAAAVAVAAAGLAAVAGIAVLVKASFDLASEIQGSQRKIQSQLGLTGEEAEKLGDIAKNVWANNFAGSVEEAADALVIVRQQLKGISDEELQDATENAFRLSDAFGIDIVESTNAANTLMSKFGLSQDEAFGLITKGFQNGLNSSDDFLDSVGEYSGLFADAGGDAGQFLNLLETGLQGGVLGTDKAADAFKEFSLKFGEGSDETKEALAVIGLNWDGLIEQVNRGEKTIVDVFGEVTQAVGKTDTSIIANRNAVNTLSTQFEDLGPAAVGAISVASQSLGDLSTATDTLDAQYNTLPQAFEGVRRQLLVAILPIGEALLEVANNVMPMFLDAVEKMKPFVEEFAIVLGDKLVKAAEDFSAWMKSTGIPLLKQLWSFISESVIPAFKQLWTLFQESKTQGETVKNSILAMKTAIEPFVTQVMGKLLEIFEIIKAWIDDNWPLIQATIETVMTAISNNINAKILAIQTFWNAWGEDIMALTRFYFGTIFAIIKNAVENVLGLITVIMSLIVGDWEGAWEEIQKITKRTWNLMKGILTKGLKIFSTIIKKGIKKINIIVTGLWANMKIIISATMEEIKTILSGIWGNIKTIISAKVEEIKTAVTEKFNELKNKISEIWNGIKSNVEIIITKMIEAILAKISESVTSVKDALLNTLKDAIAAVSDVIDKVKKLQDIAGNIITAIGDWLKTKFDDIRKSIVDTIKEAAGAFLVTGSLLRKLQSIASKVIEEIESSIKDKWADISSGIQSALEDAAAFFSTLPSSALAALNAIGSDIIAGIIAGISSAQQTLKDMLSSVMDLIPGWLKDFIQGKSPAGITVPIGKSLIQGVQQGVLDQVPNLMKQLQSSIASPIIAAAPALGASSTISTTNIFNTGGNTISSNMDAAVFEARVIQVIERNLT